ncbi:MAG: CPBP family glutamic-type intramembrane protease [bacterium]
MNNLESSALVEYLFNHAFHEELIFRFLPLTFFARWVYYENKIKCDTSSFRTIAVIAVSSIIFGWLHGGFWNIFVQGVYGVVFATIFIFTANKMPTSFGRGTRSVIGLYAATCFHAFSNYAIMSAALN